MSESEFELYLSLLTRFLRLQPGQRTEIADELRDHLEARLEELSKTGMSREQAIHAALGEFGDAAELAQHFALIAKQRRRRFIMRCTAGTVAGLTAAILLTTAFWPGENGGPMRQPAVAQNPADATTTQQRPAPAILAQAARDAENNSLVEAKLARPFANFDLIDKPLNEVLEILGDALEIDFIIDEKDLSDQGIAANDSVSFGVKHTKLSAAAQLRLILGKLGAAYRIEDGLVIIESKSTVETHREARVYNCRDLLKRFRRKVMLPTTGRGIQPPNSEAKTSTSDPPASTTSQSSEDADQVAARELIGVLCLHTNGPWEVTSGDGGYISEYNGLLLASNTQEALRELDQFLETLRKVDLQDLPAALESSGATSSTEEQKTAVTRK